METGFFPLKSICLSSSLVPRHATDMDTISHKDFQSTTKLATATAESYNLAAGAGQPEPSGRVDEMATVLNPPEEAAQTVILHNVSWDLYEHLLAEHEDVCNPRFAYDRGVLQIMVTSFEHEQLNRLIADIFGEIADELCVDYINAGSTTFNRRDLEQGFEADTSFYIQNVEHVRGKKRIDLTQDPPPDLVIEIDITHSSLNKFPVFAGLGIPEVWRNDGKELAIFKLEGETYSERAESQTLPGVTSAELTRLITQSQKAKRTEWRRSVREWARELKSKPGDSPQRVPRRRPTGPK